MIDTEKLITVLYPPILKSCGIVDIAFNLLHDFYPFSLTEKEVLFFRETKGFFNYVQAALTLEQEHANLRTVIRSATEIHDFRDIQDFEAKLYSAVCSSSFAHMHNKNEVLSQIRSMANGQHTESPKDQDERNILHHLRNSIVDSLNAQHAVQSIKFNSNFYDLRLEKGILNLAHQESVRKHYFASSWRIVASALENRDYDFALTQEKEFHRYAQSSVDYMQKNSCWNKISPQQQAQFLEIRDEIKTKITANYEATILNRGIEGVGVNTAGNDIGLEKESDKTMLENFKGIVAQKLSKKTFKL